jgi:phage repressor protein C with HTH and peptisase S24 domain
VPLTSLRAAAGRWSQEQQGLEQPGEWAEDWITYETRTRFEPGMFVARAQGDSMAPEIPDGAYCLFRQARGGSRRGRKLLVWHSGIADPHTGGQYAQGLHEREGAGRRGRLAPHAHRPQATGIPTSRSPVQTVP